MTDYQTLLDENQNALEALSEHIPPKKSVDVVVSAKFPTKEIALEARQFVQIRTLERDGGAHEAGFTINMEPDANGFHDCNIRLFAQPTAEIITDAEMVIREACERFGGEQPGWDIVLPGSGRVRENEGEVPRKH